jgi:hypothetical protein
MTTVRRLGNFGVIEHGAYVNTFEITGSFTKTAQPGVFPLNSNKLYERQPMQFDGFKIVPHGDTNNLPIELRDTLDENNFAESILKRRRNLLYGQMTALYYLEYKEGNISRVYVKDDEIEAWLKKSKAHDYVLKATTDFIHTDGYFTMVHRNKGVRVGEAPKIAKLSHVSVSKARLGWPEDGENVTEIIKGDFVLQKSGSFKSYPVFDETNPFMYPLCMSYSSSYSFCRDFYSHPAFFGSLKWVQLSSSLAILLSNFNINAAAVRLHIKSPASYWAQKKEEMKINAIQANRQFDEKEFEQYKDKVFAKFSETLTGIQNVGKFMTTETSFNADANEFEGWEVEPIDQKIKEFVDAQIAIANKADSTTTSGFGLHPSLSNIMVDGKMASGSEMLYALKLYLATDVDIDEEIVLREINKAIEINFPDKKLKLGFYHAIVKTEDSVTSSERTKNKV